MYTQCETLHRKSHETKQIRDFSHIHCACIWCNYSCWQFAVPSERSKKTSHLRGYRFTLSIKGGQGANYFALGCHQVNIVTVIKLRSDFSLFSLVGEENSVKDMKASAVRLFSSLLLLKNGLRISSFTKHLFFIFYYIFHIQLLIFMPKLTKIIYLMYLGADHLLFLGSLKHAWRATGKEIQLRSQRLD